ncbi:MAG TPA: DNA mismatch repair protein MutS, partial [Chitinophagaceae bacterium]
MNLFPTTAGTQLEFHKIQDLLAEHCEGEYAKDRAANLEIHTTFAVIDRELRQSFEFRQLLESSVYFPGDLVLNIAGDLKLLGIPGAVVAGEQFVDIRKLAETIEKIFRWFDTERRTGYPALFSIIGPSRYEKKIIELIDEVVDDSGQVKDTASPELRSLRVRLFKARSELRRMFERVVSRLNKQGYLAEIEESFMNGRKVVAVVAEQKRMIKGILHGESDTRRTAFIEPEETIGLNNEIVSLENDERKEVYRILKELTGRLSVFQPLLVSWHQITGEYDFIRGKGRLAIHMKGEFPQVNDRSGIGLVDAMHPLLYLHNKRQDKRTIPLTLTLTADHRILVISGPNAGGKTVAMKTVGLLQMMVQAGLLVPVNPSSQFGVFRQLMIHIGDEQSIEFELSTYSSHLLHMKHFIEHANGRTLFFIDELGSGSDPNLGGAFAEVILEELTAKHAYGIVTTHYLNLKVMANKTPGIVNGAMAFDEGKLVPLYRLIVGKPGSSYTFSIAERIGMRKELIDRARKLVDDEHFQLDKLLNTAEQDLQKVQSRERELQQLLGENARLKKELQDTINREKHEQQLAVLKEQNRLSEERITYL